ncbi:MAG: TRAP transporter TatT component family protein [Treponema sp.]|jgi:predicted anti-sigma-YlaC factor YlaD|nr:TRAP transporter TatT component family protein [Treponema sp.]
MQGRIVFFPLAVSIILLGSCSINHMAINAVSNALTGAGNSTVFTGEEDPELAGNALPFAIKMYESLLAANPRHEGLILTTGSLFVMYANAFVQGPAQILPRNQYAERERQYARAKKFYLRGGAILYSGLDNKYPGFSTASGSDAVRGYLGKMQQEDVPFLYWTAAGLLSAYSLNPFDLDLGRKAPELLAYIDRAYALDPDFNQGALDEFYLLFYASMPEGMGGNKSVVDTYFQRALEKSGGRSPGPYIAYAEAVCIPAQDYATFKAYLEIALVMDPDGDPANRLVTILSQRKARYLLEEAGNFFLDAETDMDWDDADQEVP